MADQLTLGGLLDALEALEQRLTVHMAGFGGASTPFGIGQHRIHSEGLAIHVMAGSSWTVSRLVDKLRRRLYQGWIGEFVATPDTPMWAQPATELQFNAVSGVEVFKGYAVIRSKNTAPVQGPRWSDSRMTKPSTGCANPSRSEQEEWSASPGKPTHGCCTEFHPKGPGPCFPRPRTAKNWCDSTRSSPR